MIYGGLFDLDSKKERLNYLNSLINSANFWNQNNREEVLREEKSLSNIVNEITYLNDNICSNIKLFEIDLDLSMLELLSEDYNNLFNRVDKLRIEVYLSGQYDKNNCFLEIHSGAGGTEACDWVMMLYRMYTRFITKSNFTYTDIDKQYGDEAGFKNVIIKITGNNAYGYFKGEKGIHRLVRISPFDAGKRRHTSFASVEITPEFDVGNMDLINEKDLKIDIYRSSGPGGQGVNTTDSAVRVTHIPTGIVVTCQNERSQIRNKETALEILKNKLYNLEVVRKEKEIDNLKGEQKSISFGSARRSYVMCPYTLVKDNISGFETGDVTKILDGDILELLEKNIRR